MGASVFLAQSTRDLLPGLADRLRAPQDDPFAPEILVVPTAGARDWLIERLAHELDTGDGGILANVEFWFPNEFNLHAIGLERVADDPWSKSVLRWTLLGLLSSGDGVAPGFAGSRRPLGVAERIAHLYDQYGVYRPEMPATWAVSNAAKDPQYPLAPDDVWQFDLWKVVHSVIGASPGERFIEARKRLSAEDVQRAVRGRISVFGLDVFSPAKVSLLAAMSQFVDVAVFGVFPSLARLDVLRAVELGDRLRREHDLTALVEHPLARSWSRAGLEAMALLTHELPAPVVIAPTTDGSVLGRLQRSIADDVALVAPGDVDAALAAGDGSVQIHLCHGATRQVEVLRDALLHRLAADASLHPRDIVVVCPDLETYAPLLEPVMGARLDSLDGERSVQLPLAIIDKSTATSTPVADTIAALFDAVSSRLGVGAVLELLAHEPVRRRFGFAEDDLATIDRWSNELGVHWGIDGDHRAEWGYPAEVDAGTWRAALDRLAAGIVLAAPEVREAPSGVVPFDDVSGSSIELIGRLADLLGAVEDFARAVAAPMPIDEWAEVMERAIDAFLAVPDADSNQIDDVRSVVRALRTHADAARGAELDAQEIAALIAAELDGVRQRSRVWGDVVRVASLSRLRGISARVIAILGFDDRAFATGRGAGDDILLVEPRLAERDFHSEERLGLLGLLAAATDAVLITCNGHDVTNNKPVPLAVPLEELKDAVVAVIAEGGGGTIPVVVQHSRQAADPVNFDLPGSDAAKNVGAAVEGPWSFDPSAALITARMTSEGAAGSDAEWPIFPWDARFESEPLSIGDLHDAVRRPAQLYVRERLQITLPGEDRSVDDTVMLWPGSLERYGIATEVIAARRAGTDDASRRALRALIGDVPMGALAEPFWDEIEAEIDLLLGVDGVDVAPGDAVPIEIEVDGVSIVDSVRVRGHRLVTVTYSKKGPRHRTRPWLELAALTVADPDTAYEAVVISRMAVKDRKAGHDVEWMTIRGETAVERLAMARSIVQYAITMRRLALQAVIPLFENSSWEPGGEEGPDDEIMKRDLRDGSASLLFGAVKGWMLVDASRPGSDIRPIDTGIGTSGTRFQRYAEALLTTFDATTEMRGINRGKVVPKTARKGD